MITIIPAIDIIGGECVRLSQGDYNRKTSYYKDPLEVALRYADCGVQRLHLVDLDGAKMEHPVNLAVLERIVSRTPLEIQYGGGIKSEEALKAVFSSGAKRAICGSIAATQPDKFSRWIADFGPERMILSADTREEVVLINGWQQSTTMSIEELVSLFRPIGLSQVICTDIVHDGMLNGPSIPLYTKLQSAFPEIDITVSGGISSWDDIEKLDRIGLRSVIVGKAIYEGRISLDQLRSILRSAPNMPQP